MFRVQAVVVGLKFIADEIGGRLSTNLRDEKIFEIETFQMREYYSLVLGFLLGFNISGMIQSNK